MNPAISGFLGKLSADLIFLMKEVNSMPIKNNLKSIRHKYNLTQEDLAEATGYSNRSISRLEREDRNPSVELALRLSSYLKIPVEALFELND